jgi:hypothetical protein
MTIDFDTPDLDGVVERAIRQKIGGTLATLTCPVHHKRLEAVHVAGEFPGHVSIKIEGCCDEIVTLAKQALGASEDNEHHEDAESLANTEMAQPLRAFISYADEDKELAHRIASDLHAAGIDTFFAEWEIMGGDSLRQKIDDGIESSSHFLVLLTAASIRKPWVNAELDAAFVKRIEGYARLIPIRYELSVVQLPPLLRGMHSPELVNYDEDIKSIIGEIRGLTRKPPVRSMPERTAAAWGQNLALSPLASTLAELFARRSVDGRAGDPRFTVDDMLDATDASENDLVDAISELEDLGWVEPQRLMFAGPRGYHDVFPTGHLFEHVDSHVMGWNPPTDAQRVAAEILNSEEQGLQAYELASRLDWGARRINPALSFLISRDLVLSSDVNDPVFVTPYVGATPKTRRFVRSAG